MDKRTAVVALHGDTTTAIKVEVTDDQMALLKFIEDESENAAKRDYTATLEVHYLENTPEWILEYL